MCIRDREKVIDSAQSVAGLERGLVREDAQQPLVLLANNGIGDGLLCAESMRTLIHQRAVFEMLVSAAFDRVDVDQLRVEPRSTLREKLILMPQPFAQRRAVVMDDGVAEDRVIVLMMPVSYTHLRAHETPEHLVCRL